MNAPHSEKPADNATLIRPTPHYRFFLGGYDLEMRTVRALIEKHSNAIIHDKQLHWGARASDYRHEINAALAAGATPVLIELKQDLDLPENRICIIDHHGPSAGHDKPTCLEQVFTLLKLPDHLWTRHLALVAANDRGYIPAMQQELDATPEEIRSIRQQDRQAQGITAEEEQAAVEALSKLEYACGGRLAVARLPHSKTAALVDRLQPEAGGPGIRNILIISPDEVNFFGEGKAVLSLAEHYPQGWYGGDLPVKGFWGMTYEELPAKSLVFFLQSIL
ncbi:hypothetical protein SAMN05421690_101064 [Nitrosomonas sp. Nm51]|uniref:hypothetical protein n=1 Tax=Nitrosomonas sp. Nm51 TaxID=133720 RepID=UPI0008C3C170|nr:hypothetical protein [Nitrosomonas sp. Nm51]SER16278.1 hypothetical protein SAMN05421690_101064 [Nitrosomonas sp. Nm51]